VSLEKVPSPRGPLEPVSKRDYDSGTEVRGLLPKRYQPSLPGNRRVKKISIFGITCR
jgi:hypothetical protein